MEGRRVGCENHTGYLKNHWTKHRLVCIRSYAFSMLIPNMVIILNNSEMNFFLTKMKVSIRLDRFLERVNMVQRGVNVKTLPLEWMKGWKARHVIGCQLLQTRHTCHYYRKIQDPVCYPKPISNQFLFLRGYFT